MVIYMLLNDLLRIVDIDKTVIHQFDDNTDNSVTVPQNEYFMCLHNSVVETSVRDNKLHIYIDNSKYTCTVYTKQYTLNELFLHINALCKKYHIDYDFDDIDTITFKIPQHCIEIVILDNLHDGYYLHDGDYNYNVFRNDMLMFSGNDSYSELFYNLLDITFNEIFK